MSTSLQVYPEFLGLHIISSHGDRRRIVAVWMEEPEKCGMRPQLVALTIGKYGESFKLTLPNPDWTFLTEDWFK